MGGGVLAKDVNDRDSVIERLQAELARTRRNSARATREIHGVVVRDLEASLARLESANRRVAEVQAEIQALQVRVDEAEARAKHAERQQAALRASATWKAGRLVVAIPARIRRLGRRRN